MSLTIEQTTLLGDVQSTPLSITGVLSTKPPTEAILIDYVAATFPDTTEVRKRLRETFDITEKKPTTVYGYEFRAMILEFGSMLWSQSRPDMGIHINLPASALAKWDRPMVWLFDIIKNNGGKLVRVDFALDDYNGLLSLETILDKLNLGDVVSRAKKRKPHYENGDIGSGDPTLTGVSVGSRDSETYMRFYDKRIEQLSKGVTDVPEHWIRCEMELSGDRANFAMDRIIASLRGDTFGGFVCSLVYGYIDFKDRNSSDTNKSRWETSGWWSTFLGNCAKSRLSIPKVDRGIAEIRDWFSASIAPMACLILLCKDDSEQSPYDWLMRTIADGEKRFKAKHKKIMGDYNDKVSSFDR